MKHRQHKECGLRKLYLLHFSNILFINDGMIDFKKRLDPSPMTLFYVMKAILGLPTSPLD